MERKVDGEEITNFDLKCLPNLLLISSVFFHFFFVKHGNVGYFFNEFFFGRKAFSCFCHRNPFLFFSLFFCSNSKLFKITGQVNYWIIANILTILKMIKRIYKVLIFSAIDMKMMHTSFGYCFHLFEKSCFSGLITVHKIVDLI